MKFLTSILLLLLAVTSQVAAQQEYVYFEDTEYTMEVTVQYNDGTEDTYVWEVFDDLAFTSATNTSKYIITGTATDNQLTITWNETGIYYLRMTETNQGGCTNFCYAKITIHPNKKVEVTNLTSNQCYTGTPANVIVNLSFTNQTVALPEDDFPITVSYTLNGIAQADQSVSYANQYITILGSDLTSNSGSDTDNVIVITGAKDHNNLTITPVTTAGQDTHTHTIYAKPSSPAISATATNLTCTTITSSLTASATDNSGASNLTYAWTTEGGTIDSGEATATAVVSAAGTYTVTVTDPDNGCTTTANKVITQNISAPTAGITNNTGTTILTCTTTAISVTATGGGTYSWHDGTSVLGTDAALSITTPATYTVTVTSANGCTDTESIVITQNTTAPTAGITNNTGTTILTCSTTAISVTATGGGTYSWHDGTSVVGTDAALLITTPATYTVTVTAANGCTDTEAITVTQNTTAPTAGITNNTGTTILTCSTTAISVTATGGGTYSWHDGTSVVGTDAALSITTPATYTVTVTSANGCTDTEAITVTQNTTAPTAGITNNTGTTILTCSTTAISVTATGGGTYSWHDGTSVVGTDAALSITAPATYTVTVTAANGCTDTEAITVTQNTTAPTAGITNNTGTTILTCSTTAISVTATGGGTYSWSDGTSVVGTDAALSITTPATYTVTVTAANGCTDTEAITVTQNTTAPTAGITNNTGTTILTCSTTAISVTATGGGTYSWHDGTSVVGTDAALSITAPATYTVTVTAANGCTDTEAITVTQNTTAPTAGITNNTGTTILTCSTTAISVTATGGGTYSWHDGTSVVGTDAALSITAPATYTVTVTSANGCTDTESIVITQNTTAPTAGITNNTGTTILTCSTTAISVTATGGGTYSWHDGTSVVGTDAALSITAPATYTVTVTSANGCTDTESIVITQNTTAPTAGITNNTGTTILTCSTTAISVTATGGGTYSWHDGTSVVGTDAALLITTPATYTVTVTAANGCTDTESIVITQNTTAPTAGITNNTGTTILTCSTTAISVTATGGGTYSWHDGTSVAGTDAALSITAPATYTVTVTSANGCTDTESIVITQNTTAPTAGITNNTGTTILTCSTTAISVTATGGGTYSWHDGTSVVGTDAALSITAPATYTVTVTSANGCTDTESIVITQNTTAPTAGITNNTGTTILTCSTTAISVTATGGGTYSWSDGTSVAGTDAALSITAPATYTVTVTSANGCTDTEAITVTQNTTAPTAGITNNTGTTILTCSTTAISVTATGGGTYSWHDGTSVVGTDAALSITAPATYTVTVTAANGCTDTEAITVTQNTTAPTAGITNNTGTTILTCSTTAISVTATGGGTYSWHDGTSVVGTDAALSITTPATYTVTVTAANGCTDTEAITVTQNTTAPTAGITNNTGTTILTCSTTAISVTATGGGTYSWSDGTSVVGTDAALSITTPATYTVTVTAANGCTDTESVVITQSGEVPSALSINSATTVLTCSITSISLTASATDNAGTNNLTYAWTTADGHIVSGTNLATASVDAPGTYVVTITDPDNGCTATTNKVITQNTTAPTAGITNNTGTTILTCSTTAISVTATGGGTYSWHDGTSVVGTDAALSITTPATYTVTVTAANGCTDTESIVITQNTTAPTAGITNNTGTTILTCSTTAISVTATGGGTYSWHDGTSVVGTDAALSITTPATYTVTVTSANGCTDTEAITVTQNTTAPTAGITNNTGTTILTCSTTAISVTATGGGTYSWHDGTSVVGTDAALSITTPATYTVTVTAANGCTDTEAITVTQNTTAPTAGITNNTGTTILTCSTTAISVTATGGGTYSWSDGTSVVGTDAALSITTPATYTVTVTAANGCTDTESVVITQSGEVPSALSINSATTVLTCSITSISLTASATDNAGTNNLTYAWTTADGHIVSGTNLATASVDAPGTYVVTITDPDNGCTATTNKVITQNTTAPTAGITNNTGTEVLTCSTTTISVTATGGGTYSWHNGTSVVGTEAALSITTPATYTVTVTSANGCTDTESIVITQNTTAPTAGITNNTGTTILTCSTTAISVTATGGGTYSWSDGTLVVGTDAALSITTPATYTVTVTSANGCTDTESIVITQNTTAPTAGITNNTGTTILTCSTTAISVTATGGGTYSWHDGTSVVGTDAALSITTPATYTVTVTAANGCTDTEAITVTQNTTAPTAGITNNTGTTILTCSTTAISVTATGGGTYSWHNGTSVVGTEAALSITTPATYTVTVTSANGCTDTESIVITQNTTAPTAGITNNTGTTILTCSTTAISVTATGGGTYSWHDGTSVVGTDAALSITTPATYTVTVTSANGCTDTESIVITQNTTAPTAGITNNTGTTILTCSTTAISVTATGGGTYSWHNGTSVVGTEAALSITTPATYTVTVTSANGCTDTESIVITQNTTAPTAGITNNTGTTILTCSTTAISVTATGGGTYSWSDGTLVVGTDAALSITTPATYTVTVTSANGCTDTESIVITQNTTAPTAGITNNTGTTILTCSTTAISVTATGGGTYSWHDGTSVVGTDAALSITAPATYTVTVTSANGCTDTESIVITQNTTAPTAGITNNTGTTILTCSTTAISVTATGGGTYSWHDGTSVVGTDAALSITAPATYTVTVTSANGCTDTEAITVTQNTTAPTAGITNNTGTTILTCSTTAISVTATGGGTYSWHDGTSVVGTDAALSITAPATYTVTVTSANGCTDTEAITVTQNTTAPTAGITNNTGTTILTCSTTAISVTATGGGTYSWFDGTSVVGTDAALSITSPATYTVTVTAANGCTDTESVVITQNTTAPTAGITNNTGTTILTCSTTAISVTATGGGTYSWSDGTSVVGTDAALSITSPATYTVTVTAANGCTDTESVVITQSGEVPSALSINSATTVLTCSITSISLTASATDNAGTNNLTYAWTTADGHIVSGTNLATASVDAPGTYVVTITDPDNGCTATTNKVITQNTTAPTAGITNNTGTEVLTCSTTTISVTATGGGTYSWHNGTSVVGTEAALSITTPATYTVTVTSANGCTDTESIVITQNTTAPTAGITNNTGTTILTCSTTAISVTATGGGTYSWHDGTSVVGTDAALSITTPATYTVTVTAANGCTDTEAITVTQNTTAPTAGITNNTGTTILTCSTTTISVTATGGGTYSWHNGTSVVGTEAALSITTPATYTVTVTSANGCTDTESIVITQNTTAPTAGITNNTGTTILTCSTTAISVTATGGGTYSWSDGTSVVGTDAALSITSPATYTVTVTAANGCTDTESIVITQNTTAPTAGITNNTGTTILTCSTTAISVTATGGGTYSWHDGTSVVGTDAALSITTPATYTVTVTAANGCTDTEAITVTQNTTAPTAGITNNTGTTILTCSTTAISVTATGGGTYSWSDGTSVVGTDAALSITTPATYTVTVTAANGCTDTESVVITQSGEVPSALSINSATTVLTCSITSISLTASATDNAGTNNLTYAWTTADGHIVSGTNLATASVDAPGTYVVTITDPDNGCTATTNKVITQNTTAPTAGITNNTGTEVLTCSTTTISVTATGGGTYSWHNGTSVVGTEAALSITTPATYTVTVTSANGCTDTESIVITQNTTAPTAGITNNTGTTILTCSTTAISVTATGGGTYSWSDGTLVVGTDAALSITTPATYTVTVTSANGCTDTESIVITQNTTAPTAGITNNTGTTILTCSTTAISVTATGGGTYSWHDGTSVVGTDAALSITTPATYTVTVTAANGCTDTEAITVTQNTTAPTAGITNNTGTTILTCSTTAISVTATGGGTYSWSDGTSVVGTDAALSITTPATYTVTVTAANGCTDTESVVITQSGEVPSALSINSATTVLTCSITSISLTASATDNAGTNNLTYAWTTADGHIVSGTNLATASVDAPGTYVVTITDPDNGCTATTNKVITQNTTAPTAGITNNTGTTILTCSTTAISVTATGGGTYSWHDGTSVVGTDAALSITTPATYTVTVTAANGCTDTESIVITQNTTAPTAGITNNTGTTILTCSTTAISVTATGGGTYSWHDGTSVVGTDAALSITTPATYTVTVTSANGCTDTEAITVTQNTTAPTAGITNNTGTTILTCSTTTISVTATGGGTYSWHDGTSVVGTDAALSITTPATYTVTVTSANGCTDTEAITVTQNTTAPTAGITNNTGTTILTCSTTAISVTATGGGTYSWSDGTSVVGTDAALSITSPATYTVTVTAANGCTDTESVVITQSGEVPSALSINSATTVLTCSITSISLTASATDNAGTNNLTYAWTTADGHIVSGTNLATASVDAPGTYVVTITDPDNGCTATTNKVITQNTTAPTAGITNNTGTTILTCSTTAISVTATGGGTYSWHDGTSVVGTDAALSITTPATYTVTVTAANGCTDTEAITVTQNTTAPTAGITNNTGTTILTCSTTAISVTATGGGTYSWSDGTSVVGTDAALSITTPATYTVTVTAANGCTDTESVVITQSGEVPSALSINSATTVLTCSITSISLTASATDNAGTNNLTYAWTTADGHIVSGTNLATASVDAPGTYVVTITDPDNGCTATTNKVITQNTTAPTAGITNNTGTEVLTCSTTTISVTATGGGTYSWHNGTSVVGTEAALSITTPATYTVTVTSANGCTDTESIVITQNTTAPTAGITNNTGTTILTCSTTAISVTATGGGTYSWSDGTLVVGTDAALSITTPATYTVTVTAANGCTDTESVVITQSGEVPSALSINSATTVLTCSITSISLTASATDNAGTNNLTYAWTTADGHIVSGATLATASVDAPGTYVVTITDPDNGCTATTNKVITQNTTAPMTSSITGSATPACNATGITYSVTNTAGSSYAWTVPSGASITAGSTGPNNNQITVNFGTTSGDITVTETNSALCVGATKTLSVVLSGCGLNADFTGLPLTICQGSTVNFTNTSTGTSGATTYSWDFGSGASPATATGVGPHTVTYSSSGTKAVSLTITEGASDTETKTNYITVSPATDAGTVTGGATVCAGTNSTLLTLGAHTGNIIKWQSSPDGSAWNDITPIVTTNTYTATNLTSTSYYRVMVQSGVCSAVGSVAAAVIVNALPTIAVSTPATCAPNLLTYSVSVTVSSGNVTSTAGTVTNPSGNIWTVSGVPTGTYITITVTDSNLCTKTLGVSSPDCGCPASTTPGSASISATVSKLNCNISTSILTATAIDNEGASNLNYAWNTVDGGFYSPTNRSSVTVTNPGTYTVTITDPDNGCFTTVSKLITGDYAAPTQPSIISSVIKLTCINQTSTLSAVSRDNSGSSNLNYLWTTSDGHINTNPASASIVVSTSGTYKITITDPDNGCTSSSSQTIEQDIAAPGSASISATATQLSDAVKNSRLSITANDNSESSNLTYLWTTSNGTIASDVNTNIIVVTSKGTYTVTITDPDNGCTTSVSQEITYVNLPPTAQDGTISTGKNRPVDGTLNYSDPDTGNTLTVNTTPAVLPTHGIVTIKSDGTYTYTPNDDFIGTDQFTYEVCDNGIPVKCDQGVITVSVLQNNAPTPINDPVSTIETNLVSGNMLTNDSDPEGDVLTLVSVGGITNAAIDLVGTYGKLDWNTNGTFTYTPNTALDSLDINETVTDEFNYIVTDASGNQASAKIIITISGKLNTITVAVNSFCNNNLPYISYTVTPNFTIISNSLSVRWIDSKSTIIARDSGLPLTGTLLWPGAERDGTGNAIDWPGWIKTNGRWVEGSDGFEYSVPQATIEFLINPGKSLSVVYPQVTMSCAPVPPLVAVNDIDDTEQNKAINISVLDNDSGISSGSVVTTISATSVNGGTLVVNADRTIKYTPATDFSGTDQFTYQVCDATAATRCSQATVSISVIIGNHPPLAQTDNYDISSNTTLTGSLSLNDSDSDGDILTYNTTPYLQPSKGTITIGSNGAFIYTPFPGVTGTDQVIYQVCDNNPSGSLCSQGYLNITIKNGSPIAKNDSFTTIKDNTLTGNVNSNDSDPENGILTYNTTPQKNVSHGTLVIHSDGTFSYTPTAGYTGPDSFVYRVCDNGTPYQCSEAQVNITVTEPPVINIPPVAVNDINNTLINVAVSGNVLTNDYDVNGDQFAIITNPYTSPSNGTVIIRSDGSYTYTPNNDYVGEDFFMYVICEVGTNPILCDTAIVTIEVRPIVAGNRAPVANEDEVFTTVNKPVSGNVLTNDFDPDMDIFSASRITSNVKNGRLVFNNDGTFTYTPNTNFKGTDYFIYEICDKGSPSLCSRATVTITVNELGDKNNSPFAADDAIFTYGDPVNGNVSGNDTDPDGDLLSFAIFSNPTKGTVTMNANGAYVYTPNSNSTSGSDQFVYQVCDNGTPVKCSKATVYVTIIINHSPVAVNDQLTCLFGETKAGNVLLNDTDQDSDILTVKTTPIAGPNHGTLLLNANGTYTYAPANGYEGNDSFIYEVCDDGIPVKCNQATVSITMIINHSPVAVNDQLTSLYGETKTGNVLLNDTDPDNDVLSVKTTPIAGPLHGSVQLNSNGSYTYTPANGYEGNDSFTYEVCDDGAPVKCSQATVSITMTVNHPPVAVNDELFCLPKETKTGNVLFNDTDPDNDILTVKTTPIAGPLNGSVQIKANGSYTYTPAKGFKGNDSITYEICDDGAPVKCAQAKIYITVQDTITGNRLATNDINTTLQNQSVEGNVLTNDDDYPEVNSITTLYSEPLHGTVVLNTNGIYNYTPQTDYIGVDKFYYVVCNDDPPADCDTMKVTINVLPDKVKNGPVANNDETETKMGVAVTSNLLSNDYSPSGEPLQLNIEPISGPDHGTVTISADGLYTYTPDPDYTGIDQFTYELCGLISEICVNAKVTINVAESDNNLIFAADDALFTYGAAISGNVLDNDIYPSINSLNVNRTPLTAPTHGSVVINSDGTFTYTPNSGYEGIDHFVYEICDNVSEICDNATVTITVLPAPVQYADLVITKSSDPVLRINEEITYELLISNLGNSKAVNVRVGDYLPAYIQNPTYTIGNSTTSKAWPSILNLGELNASQSVIIYIKGIIGSAAPDEIVNYASVGNDIWDPDFSNNISIAKTTINRSPLIIIAGGADVSLGCCNTQGITIDASQTSGETTLRYRWTPNIYLDDPTIATPHFTPGDNTEYTLTVTDLNGLSSTKTVRVQIVDCPDAITDHHIFVETPNTTLVADGSESTGAGISFRWSTSDGIILNGETNSTAQISGLGKYYLEVTDSYGCSDIDSLIVGLYVQAINDTASTMLNTTVDINVATNDIPQGALDPSSISITTPPNHGIAIVVADSLIAYTPNQYYAGSDEFIYVICDYFLNCDEATVLVIVNDEEFFIPEAFSPNGDGTNDLFEIKGISKYKQVQIEIINRWGNVVYSSKNYGLGDGKDGFWDGVANTGVRIGQDPVPSGTYFYIMRFDNGGKVSGSVYIDR